ncbi:MAG: peptide chain release factor N(5)-glutamine methyltransferase [Pseudorhodoplanes sp.]
MNDAGAAITVEGMRRTLTEKFRAAGIESPALDARLLVQAALNLNHAGLVAASDRVLTQDESAAVNAFAARRLAHEPVARIVGEKEFWGLPLRVTPAVLVPRPDTETIVSEALRLIDAEKRRAQPLRILDIGTGSGAILLALLSELPNARGVATDISTAALALARENAQRLSLSARTFFVACDVAAALAGGFDIVVSNPPYIESGMIAGLMPDVRDYDPRTALDGGIDGLAAYRRIAADAPRLMAHGAHLLVEVGAGQADAVAGLFAAAGFAAKAAAVLAGIPRVVRANKG